MTIKECIKKALRLLGLSSLFEKIEAGEAARESAELLDMTRDVVAEICSDFYPLKVTEKLAAGADRTILISKLSKPVIDVFSVKKNGTAIPFVVKFDRIELASSGEVEVEYSYMPSLTALTTTLPFCNRVDERLIALGIAAEYCFVNRPAEAEQFDTRYKNALTKAVLPKGEKKLRPRAWA